MLSRRQFVSSALAAAAAATLGPRSLFAGGHPEAITVSAGKHDRTNAIVSFPADPNFQSGFVDVSTGNGPVLPLQYTPEGRGVFVIPTMKAGETHTYRVMMIKRTDAPPDRTGASKKDGAIAITVDDRHVFTYRGEKTQPPAGIEPVYARGGYLHPLVTPGGVTTTDDYPKGHKHHHGVWSPWTSTQFEGRKPDFWNMGSKTGTVEFVEFGPSWQGRVTGGFIARHRMVDLTAKPDPKPAINETWQVAAYALGASDKAPAYHLFDWQSTQTTAGSSPLVLPKYHYGGLGVRGHGEWDGADNSKFLSSEGKTRLDGNETRARWMCNYGKVGGKPAYMAVLCSPDNFRAPQPVRFHPKEPFMCFVPQQLGDMAIEPGKPYVMKYRFVIGDGEPDKSVLDQLWQDYAEPVTVRTE